MLTTLWYLLYVSMKPLPFVGAGIVGGWLTTALAEYQGDTEAIAIVVGLAAAFSLVFLPPLLALYARARAASEGVEVGRVWLWSALAGALVLGATLALMANTAVRLPSTPCTCA